MRCKKRTNLVGVQMTREQIDHHLESPHNIITHSFISFAICQFMGGHLLYLVLTFNYIIHEYLRKKYD